jgi:mTERF domain-containing protein
VQVNYLKELGVHDAVLVKILASAPQLLACDIEESWDKLLRYFYYLQIELAGVRRILGVNPSVFCLNLEENIAPKVLHFFVC